MSSQMNTRYVNEVDILASFTCFYKNPSAGIGKGWTSDILFLEFFSQMLTLELACNFTSSNKKVLGSQSKKAAHSTT